MYKICLELREQQGIQHPDTAQSLNNLGSLYYKIGSYDRAESMYIRSLAIRQQHLGPEAIETAASLNNLAFLYQSMQRYHDAEILYLKSLKIRNKRLGSEHPKTKKVLLNFENFLQQVVATGQVDRLSSDPLTQDTLQKIQ